jgi:putative DNA primase/helicase
MKQKNFCQAAIQEIVGLDIVRSDGEWLYFYEAEFGAWRKHDAKEARRKIRLILKERFADLALNETKLIEAELLEVPELYLDFSAIKNEKFVNARNGMINIETLEKIPHSKDFYETVYLDFKFDPRATWSYAPNWVRYISTSLGGKLEGTKVKLLLQILLYSVSNLHGAKKMFCLVGKPHCGKSRVIEFIKRIAKSGGHMPLTLNDLSDRFRSGLLETVRLVINDELPSAGLKNLDVLKKIIAEEDIVIESKGKTPKCFSPKVKLIFGGNQLPNSKEYDFGNAFADRLCVLKFPNTIERAKWDLALDDRLYDERNTIMSLALMQANSLLQSKFTFAEPEDSAKILGAYKADNASVQMFVQDEEICQWGPKCKDHISNLYSAYEVYARNNALAPVKISVFRQELFLIDGLESGKFRLPGTNECAGIIGLQLKQPL